jgi:hypothetical protein
MHIVINFSHKNIFRARQSGFWPQNTNLRWVHMLSQRVAVIRIVESTSAAARACITPASRAASTERRWKRFLSLVSPRAAVSEPKRNFGRTELRENDRESEDVQGECWGT